MTQTTPAHDSAPAATGAAEVRVVRFVYDPVGQKTEEITFTGTAEQVRQAQETYFAASLPVTAQTKTEQPLYEGFSSFGPRRQ